MIAIPLKRGHVAIVDDEDAHFAAFKWTTKVGSTGVVYAIRSVRVSADRQSKVLLHREVLGLKPGDGIIVDHIDGDGRNNCRSNLRIVTRSENQRNRAGPKAGSTSGYLGVVRVKGRFQAQIGVNGRTKYLGMFATAAEANNARLAAEADLWGIHPRRAEAHAEIRT